MTISLNEFIDYEDGLFSRLEVPDNIDKELLVQTIVHYANPFELLYPDFHYMQDMIHAWSLANKRNWELLEKTNTVDYNPIENYDRTQTDTTNTTNISVGKSKAEQKTPVFDNKELVPAMDESNSQSSLGGGNTTYSSRVHGNIGVTTTQQMLQSERELRTFNIYDYIALDFKSKFCILVY